ncbi:MAG: hypothetical protein WAT52_05455 [Chitinophagales bacterium]
MKKLNRVTRIVLLVCALGMLPTLFFPIWRIDLFAPQYPEGLYLQIWKDRLTGDVDVINGLNHYIGMQHIKEEMFPEFGYMYIILYAMVGLGILAFIINRRWMMLTWAIAIVVIGSLGLYDFYQWCYDYGHNLDPNAAIKIPGMTYQPPLFGHKRLLNFDAWSQPDIGGVSLMISTAILFVMVGLEYFYFPKKKQA